MLGIFELVEELSASQEGICFTDLINKFVFGNLDIYLCDNIKLTADNLS
jgi:hypothetical protein